MTWHLKVNFSCALYRPGKWLWVDSNGTNGNTTFCRRANLSWLSAICIRFREIAAWTGSRWRCSSKSWSFLEKRPLTGKFSKMFSERIHGDRSTSCVQILWNLADQKSVKSCIAYLTQKPKFQLALLLSLLRGSRPKSTRVSSRQYTRRLGVPQISSKSVHFWRSYSQTLERRWNVPQSVSNTRRSYGFFSE